jgi:hypothetical protein
MIRTKAVKFPKDILENLKNDFPNPEFSNPMRIRMMYNDYVEMKELKSKIRKVGEFVYGKNTWKNNFEKK